MNQDSFEADATLVVAARQGNEFACSELVRRHYGTVYAIAYSRLGNREQAEDLAQEVLSRALLLLDRLKTPKHFSAWIGQITRNLATDWQRREQRSQRILPMIPLEDMQQEPADEARRDAREIVSEEQEQRDLQAALQQLKPAERDIILLHFNEGLSTRQIGATLGMSAATVSRRINDALQKLRKMMTADAEGRLASLRSSTPARDKAVMMAVAITGLSATSRAAIAASAAKGIGISAATGVTGITSSFSVAASTIGAVLTTVKGIVFGGVAVVGIVVAAVLIADSPQQVALNPKPAEEVVSREVAQLRATHLLGDKQVALPKVTEIGRSADGTFWVEAVDALNDAPAFTDQGAPAGYTKTLTGFQRAHDNLGRGYVATYTGYGADNNGTWQLIAPLDPRTMGDAPTTLTLSVVADSPGRVVEVELASLDVSEWQEAEQLPEGYRTANYVVALAAAFVDARAHDRAVEVIKDYEEPPDGTNPLNVKDLHSRLLGIGEKLIDAGALAQAEEFLSRVPGDPQLRSEALIREVLRAKVLHASGQEDAFLQRMENLWPLLKPGIYRDLDATYRLFPSYVEALAKKRKLEELGAIMAYLETELPRENIMYRSSRTSLLMAMRKHMTRREVEEVLGPQLSNDLSMRIALDAVFGPLSR